MNKVGNEMDKRKMVISLGSNDVYDVCVWQVTRRTLQVEYTYF